ncbi:MAG: hypothetical protein MNPFHGCM_00043 [Gemmatimonadaceae bacterium]|nr:hypothetical protein [Gemmatimonadaceae bacterium]
MPNLHPVCFALLVVVSLTCLPGCKAQVTLPGLVDSIQTLTERGFATLDVEPVDDAIRLIDRALAVAPTDSVLLHYRGYALYRKGSLLSAARRTREAKAVLDSAAASLTQAGKTLDWPENPALLAATLGQQISLGGGPFSAMRLGTRANGLLDDATRRGPHNPRVFLVRGISAMFKPRLFGGGVDKAGADLEHAASLFQDDSARAPHPAWGKSEVFQWLGWVRARQGRIPDARSAYARALQLDPDNRFVRDSLLPALSKTNR